MFRREIKFHRDYLHRYYSDNRMKPVHDAIQTGDYLGAAKLLDSNLVGLNNSRDWLYARAVCAQKMRLYDAAVNYLESALIQNGVYDFYVALKLIHCYQKIGKDDKALALARLIPERLVDDDARIVMTKFYENRKQFRQAQVHINRTSDSSVTLFKLEKANWFLKNKLFARAEETLLANKNLKHVEDRLLLAKVYAKQGRAEEQKVLLDRPVYGDGYAVRVQLALARRHEKLREYTRARLIYEALVEKFPSFYGKVLPYICRLHVESDQPNTLQLLNISLARFPSLQSLYFLKARHLELLGQRDAMFEVLKEISIRFPFNPKVYVKLLSYFKEQNDMMSMANVAVDCARQFGGVDKMPSTVKALVERFCVKMPVVVPLAVLGNVPAKQSVKGSAVMGLFGADHQSAEPPMLLPPRHRRKGHGVRRHRELLKMERAAMDLELRTIKRQ